MSIATLLREVSAQLYIARRGSQGAHFGRTSRYMYKTTCNMIGRAHIGKQGTRRFGEVLSCSPFAAVKLRPFRGLRGPQQGRDPSNSRSGAALFRATPTVTRSAAGEGTPYLQQRIMLPFATFYISTSSGSPIPLCLLDLS